MPGKKTPQRLGIERLMGAGDLPIAGGPVRCADTQQSAPAVTVSEGRCRNAGDWCAAGPVTALLGWSGQLCDSCYRMWLSVVLRI
jgi:hypothetical protein